jgi:CheY-like chemotaxis protein
MNGYEASRAIRQMGVRTPIIAVTAQALSGERERCAEAGMDDYLTKPFRKEDLLPLLRKWLRPRQQGGAASRPPAPPPAVPSAQAAGARAPSTATQGGRAVKHAPPRPDASRSRAVSREGQSEARVFDFEAALGTFMGQRAAVLRLLEAFPKKVEGQLQSMRQSLARADLETVRGEAHGIKGGSWNLQARELGDAAAELEAAAREGNSEACARSLERVREAFERFRTLAARILSSSGVRRGDGSPDRSPS